MKPPQTNTDSRPLKLNVWSLNHPHWCCLGACYRGRLSDPRLDLQNPNQLFNRMPGTCLYAEVLEALPETH